MAVRYEIWKRYRPLVNDGAYPHSCANIQVPYLDGAETEELIGTATDMDEARRIAEASGVSPLQVLQPHQELRHSRMMGVFIVTKQT